MYPELEPLQLTQAHWDQLRQIRKVLEPFNKYTNFISKQQPTIQNSAMLYKQLEQMLYRITKKEGEYTQFDKNLIDAVKVGLDLFNEYHSFMKSNNIYYLATILDPRIKTKWIKANCANSNTIIEQIRKFLKTTYHLEVELPNLQSPNKQKSLQYSLLEEFQSETSMADISDIY
jgi:hypothetical protein